MFPLTETTDQNIYIASSRKIRDFIYLISKSLLDSFPVRYMYIVPSTEMTTEIFVSRGLKTKNAQLCRSMTIHPECTDFKSRMYLHEEIYSTK